MIAATAAVAINASTIRNAGALPDEFIWAFLVFVVLVWVGCWAMVRGNK